MNQRLRFLISHQQMHAKQAWFNSWTDKESKPMKCMTCQRAINYENWPCTRNFFQDWWMFRSQLPLISKYIHASKGWCTVLHLLFQIPDLFFSLSVPQTDIHPPHIHIQIFCQDLSSQWIPDGTFGEQKPCQLCPCYLQFTHTLLCFIKHFAIGDILMILI